MQGLESCPLWVTCPHLLLHQSLCILVSATSLWEADIPMLLGEMQCCDACAWAMMPCALPVGCMGGPGGGAGRGGVGRGLRLVLDCLLRWVSRASLLFQTRPLSGQLLLREG